MRVLLVLSLLLLPIAGCLDGDNDSADPGPGDPAAPGNGPEEPTYRVLNGTGSITFSAGAPGAGSVALADEPFAFPVSQNVTLLHAEIRWDDAVQDLNLALASPSAGTTGDVQNFDHTAEGGSPGMPNSPHSLTISAPEAGDWLASAFANVIGIDVSYELAITLFEGATQVPDGYTAF